MSRSTDDRAARDGAEDQAAAWVVRMDSDQRTRADEEAFEQWLGESPANAQAYTDHRLLWDGMAALGDDEDARAILGVHRPADGAARSGISRRSVLAGGALAAAATVAGVVALPLLRDERYETAPGEQRRIVLADGSSVMLNTQSRLRVSFGEAERHIFLERGQAYFDVAKDATRPFRVFAGEDEIRALGTAFDVRLDDRQVSVVLEEGVVALFRGTGKRLPGMPGGVGGIPPVSRNDQPLSVMRAGQQARLQPAASPEIAAVDVPRAQAWRNGQMILDEASLGDAVADMNRYGGRRIVLAESDMADLKVSGVFHTKRPEAFVDGVTAALGVRVASEDATMILLAPAEDGHGN